ncbi:MAG: hypothetical protein ABSH51_17160 [Solirubrobacteraceae bacterium]|jgi:hypothetical protein
MSDPIRCVFCADVVGVYEPAVALGDDQARWTSIAREPHLGVGREVVAHPECARDVLDLRLVIGPRAFA